MLRQKYLRQWRSVSVIGGCFPPWQYWLCLFSYWAHLLFCVAPNLLRVIRGSLWMLNRWWASQHNSRHVFPQKAGLTSTVLTAQEGSDGFGDRTCKSENGKDQEDLPENQYCTVCKGTHFFPIIVVTEKEEHWFKQEKSKGCSTLIFLAILTVFIDILPWLI